MKLREWQISVSMVCAVLGALLAVQIRTQNVLHGDLRTRRVEEIAGMVMNLEEEKKALVKENEDLKMKLEDAAQGRNLFKNMMDEMSAIKARAGLVQVTGPGLAIQLRDSNLKIQPGEDPNSFLVHEEDLLKVSNELFAAGAEAISINEQRLMATSEIRCAGPRISVNNTRVDSPYIIKAIGSVKAMEAAIMMRGGVVESLKPWGIRINITTSEKVTIPAYKGSIANTYAIPVKEDEK